MNQRMRVVMAVQNELGSVVLEHGAKLRAVDKPLEVPARRRHQGMMDEHDTKHPLAAAAIEQTGKTRDLRVAESSGGHEWSRWHGARQSDQRHRAAAP